MGNIGQAKDIPGFSKYNRKNYIIDGNFNVWLEGTSQSTSGYGSDTIWSNIHTGSTKVHSRQTFALGQTAVPGNPKYYSRTVVTSVAGPGNFCQKTQMLENVLLLSGETVTVSFWAKADAAKNIAIDFMQVFGLTGSPSASVDGIGATLIPLTTAWTKYTHTFAVPSVAGKVLGTAANSDHMRIRIWFDAGPNYAAGSSNLGQQSGTFDIAQVQLEKGSRATEFEMLSPADVLNQVNRYYEEDQLYAFVSAQQLSRAFVAGGGSFVSVKRAQPAMIYTSVTTPTAGNVSGYSTATLHPISSNPGVSEQGIYGFFTTTLAMPANTDFVRAYYIADARL